MPDYNRFENEEDEPSQNGESTQNDETKENEVETNPTTDISKYEEHIPYPKSVFFIISNEFCERFCFYGMRAVLSLYLVEQLLFTDNKAKILVHGFTVITYLCPVFGAILADSSLGKFRTILYLSCIYAVGSVVVAMSAAPPLPVPPEMGIALGLLLIGIGTGGIKPCVCAFGGDQFVLPQQQNYLESFFSLFYFSINIGSLISMFLTPILASDVHCFGEDSCYSLAFAIPGLLMIASIVFFVAGKSMYKMVQPKENIILLVGQCMANAVVKKITSKGDKREHWLDYSLEKYGPLVHEVKILMRTMLVVLVMPLFWTLYDQQGSTWVFQARLMDGNILGYTVLPDQLQIINPFLILPFIPLFQYGVYPLFAKCSRLRKPLERIFVGGILITLSFFLSALVSLRIEQTLPVVPSPGHPQLRIYNGLNCNITIPILSNYTSTVIEVPSYGYYENIHLNINGNTTFKYSNYTCNGKLGKGGEFKIYDAESVGYFFYNLTEAPTKMFDDVQRGSDGYPKVRTLANLNHTVHMEYYNSQNQMALEVNQTDETIHSLLPDKYEFKINNVSTQQMEFFLGGVYTVIVDDIAKTARVVIISHPSDVSMLWTLPQYIIITAAEILFSITGLEFSYSQAPKNLKSVVQAIWLLTVSLGDAVIVLISWLNILPKHSSSQFMYTGLMVLDVLLLIIISWNYHYVTPEDMKEIDENSEAHYANNNQSAIGEDNENT